MGCTIWRFGSRGATLLTFALALILGGGCGDESPVGPSPSPGPAVTAQSITLSGVTTLQRPGDTSQLTAVVSFFDGTAQDVSSTAGWEMDSPGVASIGRTGLIRAEGYGQCNVTVRYGLVSARAPVRVAPEGMFLLSGHVYEESGLPLYQARVSVRGASGDLNTSTSPQGAYTLPATGDVEVRAEMGGFVTQSQRITVRQDDTLDFRLRFGSGGFGGMYRLLFVAAPSCAFPSEAMRRTYMARVEERTAGDLVVVLSGAEFVAFGEAGFTGTRAGTSLRFDISADWSKYEYTFVELLDAGRELAFSGTASGVVGNTFVTAFNGTVVLRQRSGATILQCEAADHRLEFTR